MFIVEKHKFINEKERLNNLFYTFELKIRNKTHIIQINQLQI